MLKKSASLLLVKVERMHIPSSLSPRPQSCSVSLAAALPAERRVLAHRGGRVRLLAILSILQGDLMVFHTSGFVMD